MIREAPRLLSRLREIHERIRDAVVAACEQSAVEQLSAAVAEEGGDTIFAIDRVSERVLLEHFASLADDWSMVLIAEGLGSSGVTTLPHGTREEHAELRVIVDPIDGTRGLMYQKRSAWILTGVAPNRGAYTSLADIELAVQSEIPLVKQHLCDALWAVEGVVGGERVNRLNGERAMLVPRPSRSTTIAQGYGGLARFFPGARGLLAEIDDAVVARLMGPTEQGRAHSFEDQYICSGGQLYELMMGHDRWIADLRPLVEPVMRARGEALGLCCHPYDLCTESIARAAGVVVTDAAGERLSAPLDVSTDMSWIGYANSAIATSVAPVLRELLAERGMSDRSA